MKEYIVTEHSDFPYEEPKPQELIRCKDCKHRPYRSKDGEVIPRNEITNRCPCVNDDDWYYNWYPEDDWYCANAEPKEQHDH